MLTASPPVGDLAHGHEPGLCHEGRRPIPIDLITKLYEAAASEGDQKWQEVAFELRNRLAAVAVVLDDGAISGSPNHLLVNSNFDAELVRLHFEEFATADSNIGVRSLLNNPVEKAFDIHHGLEYEVWHRDPSVANILTPQGITEGALVVMERGRERLSSLMIYRDDRAGRLNSDEVALLESVALHMRQAFQVRRRFLELIESERQAHLLLADMSTGLLITDRRGLIKRATGLAGRALSDEASIYGSRGRLRARDRTVDALLLERFCSRESRPFRRPILIAGPTSPRIVLRELPTAAARSITSCDDCAFLIDLEKVGNSGRRSELKRVFGFTEAEANVAVKLMDGLSVTEIAARRGNSVLTVRTHVKNLLSKSGARRQAELVALLLSKFQVPR